MSMEMGMAPMICPRCGVDLKYAGTKEFREGANWGILGSFGEMFEGSESFDVYFCPRCGRVEMFVDGVGEEFRSEDK